ncbi:MAG: DUF1501 domain-containing protein [Ignavibacteria bacterium]|nr:DUF1501 domain-containing protein [Ignavibacteria bacterium]
MNRRKFIRSVGATGVAVATLPTIVDSFAVKALAGGGTNLERLLGTSDRVLVLIQLQGGNDGLNNIIPVSNSIYYENRPRLSIKKNATLPLTDTLGWHPALAGFRDLYDSGRLAIVQGVTYPNPNRSHFRGTDIWLTATDAEVFGTSGWVGRYVDTFAPAFPDVLPPHPLAVQIGTSLSLGLLGPRGAMGVTFRDPDEFYRLVNSGGAIEEIPATDLGDTPAGREVEYMRNIARSADTYAAVVKQAADAAIASTITYPNTDLAGKLKVVSQLISGGLQSRVYLVSMTSGSFDTHAGQVLTDDPTQGAHAALLRELGDAVNSFMTDLKNKGLQDRVAGMTFSEFGRRVAENGSIGTDHGTAAPLYVFGSRVNSAIFGSDPDLVNLDERGDMLMQNDYRDVYAAMLLQWFAEPSSLAQNVLYRDFSSTAVPIFDSTVSVAETRRGQTFGFRSVSPNPASGDVSINVYIDAFEDAGIDISNVQGRMIRSHTVDSFSGSASFNVSDMPSGTYVLTLRSGRFIAHTLLQVQH